MKHSTLTCVEQHLDFKVLIVYRHSKAESRTFTAAMWPEETHRTQTQSRSKIRNWKVWTINLNCVLYRFSHSEWGFSCECVGFFFFSWPARHTLRSTSDILLGISTVTSSGCCRLLYHYGIGSIRCPYGRSTRWAVFVQAWHSRSC